MAAAKRRAHLQLLDRWLPDLRDRALLKTDLWEEGVTGDELLFTLGSRAGSVSGIDLSPQVVAAARHRARARGLSARLIPADVRKLPFADASFDVVVSTSTLDHLDRDGYTTALGELKRVLAPGGVLVVTFDNADNVGDPLLRVAARLGFAPFPPTSSLTLSELRELLPGAGLQPRDSAHLVHGPRLLTTLCIRGLRLLPERWSTPAARTLLGAFDSAGRRWPARMASFVAVRATVPAVDQPADSTAMLKRAR
jgi:SAM-dependent methyltransferase